MSHFHQSHAGSLIAIFDRFTYTKCPAIFREEREVKIESFDCRGFEPIIGDDFAIGGHQEEIWFEDADVS